MLLCTRRASAKATFPLLATQAVVATFFVVSPTAVAWAQQTPKTVSFEIREPAGIRRFGYPVTVPVPLARGSLQDIRKTRVLNSVGKVIPAQVSAIVRHPDESIQKLEIDLVLSPGPLESETLRMEYGDTVAGLQPKGGLTFAETEEAFQVSAYTIRKDARPLISNVRYAREYLKPDGISVSATCGEEQFSLAAADRKWTVDKHGPYQVRLRCEGNYKQSNSEMDAPFVLLLEFVSTKSWVGIKHAVKGLTGSGKEASLEIDASFQMGGRLLWDTDVNYWLYGVLDAGDQMTFTQQAGQWSCELGKTEQSALYAKGLPGNPRARGWGHFQEARDNGNVVAFGFSGSTTSSNYRYSFNDQGKLHLRAQVPRENVAQLDAYFHFIPVPAQHTARTSPAAMMLPLEVRLLD